MSYTVTITISCDHPGCERIIRFTKDNAGGLSKTYAGWRASVDGWKIPGYPSAKDPKRAFCPDHADGM